MQPIVACLMDERIEGIENDDAGIEPPSGVVAYEATGGGETTEVNDEVCRDMGLIDNLKSTSKEDYADGYEEQPYQPVVKIKLDKAMSEILSYCSLIGFSQAVAREENEDGYAHFALLTEQCHPMMSRHRFIKQRCSRNIVEEVVEQHQQHCQAL